MEIHMFVTVMQTYLYVCIYVHTYVCVFTLIFWLPVEIGVTRKEVHQIRSRSVARL